MHKDTKEALQRLEAELLGDEELNHLPDDDELDALLEEFLREPDEEEAPRQSRTVYQNYSNGYGTGRIGYQAYNTDVTDEDLDEYSDDVYEPQKESLTGLLITAALLLLGIAGVLLWWGIRFL